MGASGRVGESNRSRLWAVACEEGRWSGVEKNHEIFSRVFSTGRGGEVMCEYPESCPVENFARYRLQLAKTGSHVAPVRQVARGPRWGRPGWLWRPAYGAGLASWGVRRTQERSRAAAWRAPQARPHGRSPRLGSLHACAPSQPAAAVLSSSLAAGDVAGLARAGRVKAHANTSLDPARTHRRDCEAFSCSRGTGSSTAEHTWTGAFAICRRPQGRRKRPRGAPMGRAKGRANSWAAVVTMPSAVHSPPRPSAAKHTRIGEHWDDVCTRRVDDAGMRKAAPEPPMGENECT